MKWFLAFMLLAASIATPAYGQASAAMRASAPVGPRAAALFERDWVLANWALKKFDGDRDILLSSGEAAAAAAEFRRIADSDGDGRVTPSEYRAAREFILARY
jgi:hypothetical protein